MALPRPLSSRQAKTAEEEQGVNILYLALGFMTWFEDKSSSIPREAPLVLLPVELVRNQRTSTYDLRLREDDLLTNLPLAQRLIEEVRSGRNLVVQGPPGTGKSQTITNIITAAAREGNPMHWIFCSETNWWAATSRLRGPWGYSA